MKNLIVWPRLSILLLQQTGPIWMTGGGESFSRIPVNGYTTTQNLIKSGGFMNDNTVALVGFLATKLACHDPDDSAVQWALEWLEDYNARNA